ncbi:MAG: heme A synthase [Methylococcaceae bacterium]|nr:heme A synthase [Methylococcaceae bacterium]
MTEFLPRRRFRRLCTLTIGACYLVILMGGLVRASGAGMGCPDWPKCFGQLIPPTDESQLPADYHRIYGERGYADTSFNPMKTWTEYVNRLTGATTGILVILSVMRAWPLRRADPAVFNASAAALVVIAFQGWLGSAVVASNLKPVMITVHMLMAFVLVLLLIYAVARSQRPDLPGIPRLALPPRFGTVLTAAMVMSVVQIAMGTQIRQAIDPLIAQELGNRQLWRESFPVIFYVHRSFSSVILLTNLWLAWKLLLGLAIAHPIRRFAKLLVGLVAVAVATGVSLDRLGFPAFVQPLHLLLANLIFGTQAYLYLVVRYGSLVADGVKSEVEGGWVRVDG